MKLNSVQIKQEINELVTRSKEIVELCRSEVREMTEDEEKEFNDLKEQINNKKEELKALEDKLKEYERELPAEEEEDEEEEDTEKNRSLRSKNINKNTMNKLQYRFNEAVKNREYNREIEMEARNIQVTGENGTHDAVIQTDFTDILEPLYANSIISKLGIQTRTGCVNDIHVPKMTKGTVGFLGEIEAAQATSNGFDYVTLRPKRIGAYVDVSEQQLIQDSLGVFNAVQANLIKKLNEYIQDTLFDDQAATDLRPAGLFHNVTPEAVTDYGKLCDFEAGVEEDNVYGNMKYAMSPKAKAAFRSMLKGTNNTGMVYDRGEMDGIPTEVTSSVPAKKFVYGNWDNLLFATWANPILKISDSATGLITGEVRVYLGAYIDWAVLRPEAFAFGTVEG